MSASSEASFEAVLWLNVVFKVAPLKSVSAYMLSTVIVELRLPHLL